ncbi:hypothetical protein HY214_04980 [Candidatus Roizmanbacteria bacterium]|nr:hypothetical protein [Candidatus Roizmanbacteria bacterium]
MSEVYTTSIVGPDGSGKTTTVDAVAGRLSKLAIVGVLASLRKPSYVMHKGNKKLLFPTLTSKITKLYEKGQDHNPLALFTSLLSYIAMQGRLVEPYIVKNYHPDFLLQDRHRMVDSISMSHHYVVAGIPINVMRLAVEAIGGKRVTDDLILLIITPETAVIRSQRRKQSDNHESVETIRQMSAMYPAIIDSLVRMGLVRNWTSINTEINGPDIISQTVYSRIIEKK